MMNKTNIEYLDYTWNVTHGCSPVSIGCQNCWAKTTANRLAHMGQRGYSIDDPFKVVCCDWKLDEPQKVRKPSRIGVSFMGDLFHEDVPFEFIDKVIKVIYKTKQHQFLILTKRSDRMAEYFKQLYHSHLAIPNLWLGVSVEHPDYLWRIDELLKIKATVRFVSFEPMLGKVKLSPKHLCRPNICAEPPCIIAETPCPYPMLNWVIVGGESGHKARPMHPDWVRSIRDQCKDAGVPFFFKQWGEYLDIDTLIKYHKFNPYDDKRNRIMVKGSSLRFIRVGKKKAGNLLDRVKHEEFPRD